MSNGPSLVIRGTFMGCTALALLGWFLAGQINFSPSNEVAYAASSSQADENSAHSNNCQVSLSYPYGILQWCELITEQATLVELPPDLIAAVILMESGGDEAAYSSSGAVGLDAGDATRWHCSRFRMHQWTLFCQPPNDRRIVATRIQC